MGMSMKSQHGRGIDGRINITPLIDVVLVLLVLFTVLTPMRMRTLSVEVPRKLDCGPSAPPDRLEMSIRADGSIKLIDRHEVVEFYRMELAHVLQPRLSERAPGRVVYVDFALGMSYGDVVSVMDTIRGVGGEQIALVTHTHASDGSLLNRGQ